MALKTKGFSNTRLLHRHFSAHGADFNASNAQEYEQQADEFLGSQLRDGAFEHIRSGGDLLRYDPASKAFGVMDAAGVIRTYFRPVPCSSLSPTQRAVEQAAGRCHGQPDNLAYFRLECTRW
jgi:pyocin large subunit-like protein